MGKKLYDANRPLRTPALERAQFNRIYEIHRQIKVGRYPNAPRLAKHLEVQQRTVERDIEYLRNSLRAPLVFDYSRRGYYYEKPFDLQPDFVYYIYAPEIGLPSLYLTAGAPDIELRRGSHNSGSSA